MTSHAPLRVTVLALLAFGTAVPASANGLSDPTRPPGTRTASPATGDRTPRVTAILIAEGRRVAIVNGVPVCAGERIGDITIEAVLDNGVRYVRAGHRAVAMLPSARVSDRGSP